MGDIAMARSNSSVSCETEVLQCSAFPIPKIDFLGKKKAQAKWPQDKLWSSIWSQLAINALFSRANFGSLTCPWKRATRQERQNNELKMTNFCNTVYQDYQNILFSIVCRFSIDGHYPKIRWNNLLHAVLKISIKQ